MTTATASCGNLMNKLDPRPQLLPAGSFLWVLLGCEWNEYRIPPSDPTDEGHNSSLQCAVGNKEVPPNPSRAIRARFINCKQTKPGHKNQRDRQSATAET